MLEDPQLLAGIIADPGNLERRLCYADWLEENDQSDEAAARIELIRLQIRKPKPNIEDACRILRDDMYCGSARCPYCLPKHRVVELVSTWGGQWLSGNMFESKCWATSGVYALEYRETGAHFVFRNGFVDEFHGTWEAWLAVSSHLYGREPFRHAVLWSLPAWDWYPDYERPFAKAYLVGIGAPESVPPFREWPERNGVQVSEAEFVADHLIKVRWPTVAVRWDRYPFALGGRPEEFEREANGIDDFYEDAHLDHLDSIMESRYDDDD